MGSDYPPEYVVEAGVDSGLNDSRRIAVDWYIVHRPQGTCPGVAQLGRSRRHSTPGTFNQTSCDDGTGHGHYPANVKCSHAAGANSGGPGNECDGYQGIRPSDGALRALGRGILHAHHEHGLVLALYPPHLPRRWLDRDGPVAGYDFYNHASVDYPPNRSFNHYDGITEEEFALAVELAGGGAGQPKPDDKRQEAMFLMETIATAILADGKILAVGHGTGESDTYAALLAADGTTLEGWVPLGGRIYDSPSVSVSPDGMSAAIAGSGDNAGRAAPKFGDPGITFDVPFANVYHHGGQFSRAGGPGAAFQGWKRVGPAGSRIQARVLV